MLWEDWEGEGGEDRLRCILVRNLAGSLVALALTLEKKLRMRWQVVGLGCQSSSHMARASRVEKEWDSKELHHGILDGVGKAWNNLSRWREPEVFDSQSR